MNEMQTSYATVVGRGHRLMQQNCHDFAQAGTATGAPECAFGLVLDGCGSKHRTPGRVTPSHNEVGAKLLGQYAAHWLRQHLTPDASLPQLAAALHGDALTFLRELLGAFPFDGDPGRTRFLATHLLCTLLGFVVTPREAGFFWVGDGFLCHDGTVLTLDGDNRPDYLAYHLLHGDGDGAFHVRAVPRAGLTWLAVASDGWQPDQFAALATPRSSLALQRRLNVQARRPGRFEDDGAIAIFYGDLRSEIGDSSPIANLQSPLPPTNDEPRLP